jgi:RNA polymerase sigma-70 factor (ECF subfamily)
MTRLSEIQVEPAVLRAAQAGDPRAQAEIYAAFSRATYALICRLVPRRAVADDLFQDTFVEVLQSLRRFRGEAPLGAWIRRVAVSKCLMHLRSPWNRSLIWLDQLAAGDAHFTPDAAPVQRTEANVALEIDLEDALEQLPGLSRAVVWLYDVEGYTHEEIAALFGKSVSFSKSQLMRAHLRLRELLEVEPEDAACMPVSSNS